MYAKLIVFPLARRVAGLLCLLCSTFYLTAQNGLWKDISEANIPSAQADRQVVPNRYRTLRLDFPQLKDLLATAPHETDVIAGNPGIELSFPLPDGRYSRFRVWYAPILHPDLAAQFPDIRSFAGQGIDQPTAIIRFDISPNGLHTMTLRSGQGTIFIDPYAKGNTADYICYFKKDGAKSDGFHCPVDDDVTEPETVAASDRAGDCGKLRVYRLALACTGEYANYHGAFGANKAPALAAMNTSMTRVNGVFAADASIHMEIVASNLNIIYTDGATDPYTNGNGSTMLTQNQTTCDNLIGTANYDVGHVFSTGGGGVAVLNSPCSSGNKAKGVTGQPNPVGDNFDIDYVAHEMGHQYGAAHTQYNNCNRSANSAMEPGSASTIMGYAGICNPDVQPHSDAYFHARSLQQMGAFVTGSGNGCAQIVNNGNQAPSITALTNRTIPKSTPFLLSATATDGNGDALMYCWEQMNAFITPMQNMPPESANISGPMFRSFDPVASPVRYFPRYSDVLNNIDFEWEELPSVARTLNFRVTARDNRAGGGCTGEQNMTVTVSAAAGPFEVTVPNTDVNYPLNSLQTVTWNVANSNASPVNCANVDILLSVDGGQSWATLLANTPNDGSQLVAIVGSVTSQARVMISSVGNVFYDISDVNFSISTPLPVELLHFNARLAGDKVRLDWSTATEFDNKGFHIERSIDNTLTFKPIGWVVGQDRTAETTNYAFEDKDLQPGGTFYYRLGQVDENGGISYSPVKAVEVAAKTGDIAVYPNPARTAVYLRLPDNFGEESFPVTIWNTVGQAVQSLVMTPGQTLPVEDLEASVYQVQVVAGERVLTGRFVKE